MAYFFYHIPKTAGTSAKRVLEQWFTLATDASLEAGKLPADVAPDDLCITGHFGGKLVANNVSLIVRHPAVPKNPAAKVITFVRDPVEQLISYYYHQRADGKTSASLIEFAKRPFEFRLSEALQISSIADIEPRLSSFFFVGLSDDLQGSMDVLADKLAKPRIDVPRSRVGKRDGQVQTLAPHDLAAIEEMFELDRHIYQRVQDAMRGEKPLIWNGERQFADLVDTRSATGDTKLAGADGDRTAKIETFEICAAGRRVEAPVDCDTALTLELKFTVHDETKRVQPAFKVFWNKQTAFTVAYTHDERDLGFARGTHLVSATIPPNLLNLGRYEFEASLNDPYPVQRWDLTSELVSVEVAAPADARATAAGDWQSPFPGPVRPLLTWKKHTNPE